IERKVGKGCELTAREDSGDLKVFVVLFDQADEAVSDHPRTRYADPFDLRGSRHRSESVQMGIKK
ncbi:hypothetical protein, partial [Stutzerimonas nosocomialis]|uniref:hypothetical protein n=1 Tax=Stutzerimonas nosocomialis TaxID=1056496 RepID=UPI0019D58AEA